MVPLVRSNRYSQPQWRIPGGGVHQGEDPFSAAIREKKEENGLSVSELRIVETIRKPSHTRKNKMHSQYVLVGRILTLEGYMKHTVDGDENLTNELFEFSQLIESVRSGCKLNGYPILRSHAEIWERLFQKIQKGELDI
jgi:ADP-ribose pyrophosphatase YjhB (NUDIX family)